MKLVGSMVFNELGCLKSVEYFNPIPVAQNYSPECGYKHWFRLPMSVRWAEKVLDPEKRRLS